MTGNNPNLDIANINAYTKFGEILSICSLNGNKILISFKGHNSVTNWRKMTGHNPNLDLVNSKAYTKFGPILSICSKDIVQKRNSDINGGP